MIETIADTTMLDRARHHAKNGYYVIPLDQKRNLPIKGVKPVRSPDAVEDMWHEYPDALVGVALLESGVIMVKSSRRKINGRSPLEVYTENIGGLASEDMARALPKFSHKGSDHCIYRARTQSGENQQLAPGISIERTGFILAPDHRRLEDHWLSFLRGVSQLPLAPAWIDKLDDKEVVSLAPDPIDMTCSGETVDVNIAPVESSPEVRATESAAAEKTAHEDALTLNEFTPCDAPDMGQNKYVQQDDAKSVETDPPPFPLPPTDLTSHQAARASAIAMQPVRWLWPGWIAEGKLSLLTGAPGMGKTAIATSLAATVSNGSNWPDGRGSNDPGNILIWNAEDNLEETLIPKLAAAGADRNRVYVVSPKRDGHLAASGFHAEQLFQLQRSVDEAGGIKLLVIDPLPVILPGSGKKAAEANNALGALIDFTRHNKCAVLGLCDFVKGSGQMPPHARLAIPRESASLARITLVAGKIENDECWALTRSSSKLSRGDGAITYDFEEMNLAQDISAARVLWNAAVSGTAREVLLDLDRKPRRRKALAQARAFLERVLKDGPVSAKAIQDKATGAGHSKATITRAKTELDIVVAKDGMQGGWQWSLPSAL